MTYKKVAVIGASEMNSGIAHLFAAAPVEVVPIDVTTDFANWLARNAATPTIIGL